MGRYGILLIYFISYFVILTSVVGGQEKIRPLWRHYYAGVNGIIFVVDSNDKERLEEASEELHKLMREQQLNNSPLLVLANKQDLPAATPVADITRKLNLHDIYEKMQNFKSFETKVLIVHYNEQSKLLFQTTSILFSYILFSLNDVIILNVCAYIITFERESLDSSTVSSPHWFWTASRNRLVGSADVGEKVNLLVNSNVCT